MPERTRFAVIAILAFFGILLQLFVSVFFGWLAVFVGVMMGATAWKSNEPQLTSVGEWRNVTMEEIEEARKLIADSSKVAGANGPFSVSSAAGCGFLVLLVAGVLAVGGFLGVADAGRAGSSLAPVMRGGSIGVIFALDAFTLLLPLWLFGVVRTWKPPDLDMRLSQLWYVYERSSVDPRLEYQPSLQVAKAVEGSVPRDVRLMVKVKDSDPNFMGIQVQTTINKVQSRSYPYTYCVLIAKPEFHLIEKARSIIDLPPSGGFTVGLFGLFADTNEKKEAKFPRYQNKVVEPKKEGDVEIVVVRQGTGGQGYTTSPNQAYAVFSAAYDLTRSILKTR